MKEILKVLLIPLLVFSLMSGIVFAAGQDEEGGPEKIEVEYWSHFGDNHSESEKYYETLAQQFNELHPEVDFSFKTVFIPYEGYEAKYTSAFSAGKGPDLFLAMTHVWAGQFDQCDPMPDDIAAKLDELYVDAAKIEGVYDGQRYGLSLEGGNFMMLFINSDMFKEAGLDPDKPPATYTELLEYAKKLTKYDANGNIERSGYAVRYSGHPFGIADKVAPFFHAWGAEWFNWDEKKASGYLNSPQAVEALQFYGDLVQKWKVSSLELGSPSAVFSQGLAAMMFRESWYTAWLQGNAPDINFKVYPLPSQKMESGFANNFPFTVNVNKNTPEETKKWIWEFIRWYVNDYDARNSQYEIAEMFPPYKDVIEEPRYASRPDIEAIKTMANGRAAPRYYVPPAHELLQIVGQATLDVMYGKTDAQTALDKAAVEADEVLAKYK